MRFCWIGIVISALGMIGCGPDLRAMCEAEIACEGGNDLDVDACVASSEIDIDYLDDIGCGEEYDEYIACMEPHLKCQEEPTGQTCSTSAECGDGSCKNGQCVYKFYGADPTDDDTCKTEQSAFGRCT